MAYHYTKAYSQFGASMGRRNIINEPDFPVKFHLERVRLDSGGYDKGGAYWGNGNGWLYVAWGDGSEERQEMFVRAYNREQAKEIIRETFYNCKFYR